VLARLERLADRTASPVAEAAAARCRGLVDDDFEPAFASALACDDRRPMPFERARTLLAFGRRPPDDTALTPQELRVATAVQRGASNRDIAADLFLSPKTVEFHLRQIYRKLHVRSRTQLVAALADWEDPDREDPASS